MAIIEVVKYNGGPDTFVWKYPNDELGAWTQLIVNESQEAVLVKDGKICDIFQSGRYTLETANIPILNHLIYLPFGGQLAATRSLTFEAVCSEFQSLIDYDYFKTAILI